MKLTALIISTTPPIPREYGNRNRVFQTIKFFKDLDYEVSFLLYPFDSEWENSIPHYYEDLKKMFFYFDVISSSRPLHLSAAGVHHDIDEWWDDNISVELEWLLKRKKFDVVFVNYTFLSKAFSFCDVNSVKILDTHDRFAGRRELFDKFNVPPEFFYTNVHEERIGLNRADIVIGIKETETVYLKENCEGSVVCIPYWDNSNCYSNTYKLDKDFEDSDNTPTVSVNSPLKVGFIGAQNSVNIVNFKKFIDIIGVDARMKKSNIEIHVAGNVCRGLSYNFEWLKLHGRVENVLDFYNMIDIFVAPLEFSTGIKIKIAEALSFGKPIVATDDAFDGYHAFHSFHKLPSIISVCEAIFLIASNEISLESLRQASLKTAVDIEKSVQQGLCQLEALVRKSLRRIFFITDRPFWHRGCFVDELLAQALEYLSNIDRVVCVYIGNEYMDKSKVFVQFDHICCSEDNAIDVVADLFQKMNPRGAWIFIDSAKIVNTLNTDPRFCEVNQWKMINDKSKICVKIENLSDTSLPFSPLRYDPVWMPSRRKGKFQNITIIYTKDIDRQPNSLLELISESLKNAGREVSLYLIDCYDEYSSDFFNKSLDFSDGNVIFVGKPLNSWLFLKQLLNIVGAQYAELDPSDMLAGWASITDKKVVIAMMGDWIASQLALKNKLEDKSKGWDEIWNKFSVK